MYDFSKTVYQTMIKFSKTNVFTFMCRFLFISVILYLYRSSSVSNDYTDSERLKFAHLHLMFLLSFTLDIEMHNMHTFDHINYVEG